MEEEQAVNFFEEQVDKPFQDKEDNHYRAWISKVCQHYERAIGTINYIFCSDEYLLSINKQYLDHDTYTDIITFDNSEDASIEGDIFLSTERITENSKQFNTLFENELKRVMAHGILHLIGYKDKTTEDAAIMRLKEEEAIALF